MAFATGNLIDFCKRVSTNKARCKDTNSFSNCNGFSVLFYSNYIDLTLRGVLIIYTEL